MHRDSSWIVLGLAAALTGCTVPDQKPGYGSFSPAERTAAIGETLREKDRSDIPELIEMLGSEDPGVRMLAAGALEQLTGETMGYEYSASEADRESAIERWVEWWQSDSASVGGGAREMSSRSDLP